MSIIEKPPDLKNLVEGLHLPSLLTKASQPLFQEVIRKANDNYHHWDKFKHYSLPSGLSHTELWTYIKFSRSTNKRGAPIYDKEGNQFFYWIPDSLLKALNEIDRWSGGNITLDHPDGLAPKEKYIVSSLMEEAIASSQLEGAATTRQVAKEMLRSGRKPRNVSEQMILNNWETMQYVRNNRKSPLSPESLFAIHKLVTQATLKEPDEAGRLRTTDDIVVEYNGEVVHVPPKADTLPERIDALCKFFNENGDNNWIHPVIKGAMVHFWLAYDHPFTDGNGRTARALMYWYLLSRDYLLFEYLAFSRYIVRAPGRYVRAYLYTETDDNDMTYFFAYQLRAIQRAFYELREYLKRKQEEIVSASTLLKNYRGLNLRQKSLVYNAIRHPERQYTIQEHKNIQGIVYETARNDLIDLASKGFLKKVMQGREFVFLPSGRIVEKLRLNEAQKNSSNAAS
ncbi:MAG: Fic family protein [Nitrospiraceae bacterium]